MGVKNQICFIAILLVQCVTLARGQDEAERSKKINLSDLKKSATKFATQFRAYDMPDDNFEEVKSSCEVIERSIQPDYLENIHNQRVRIVNIETFNQTLVLQECVNKNSLCSTHLYYPRNKRSLCRQKLTRISLKALNDKDEVVDDQFDFPSHCICELMVVRDFESKSIGDNKTD